MYAAGAAGVVLVLALILLLVTFLPEPTRPKKEPSLPPPVTEQTANPLGVARAFLTELRLGESGASYGLLSERLRGRLSKEIYERHLKAWLASESVRWELRYREPRAGVTRELTAEVLLPPPGRRSKTWTWVLVKEESGWKLDRLEGAPFAR